MGILVWLALGITGVSALRLPATCVPRGGVVRACAEPAAATSTAAAAAAADGTEAAADEETEWKDPLGDGDFVRWYRMEKAKEAYLKENPIDPLATLGDKLGPILTSVAILLGGFYAIPLCVRPCGYPTRPLLAPRATVPLHGSPAECRLAHGQPAHTARRLRAGSRASQLACRVVTSSAALALRCLRRWRRAHRRSMISGFSGENPHVRTGGRCVGHGSAGLRSCAPCPRAVRDRTEPTYQV